MHLILFILFVNKFIVLIIKLFVGLKQLLSVLRGTQNESLLPVKQTRKCAKMALARMDSNHQKVRVSPIS